MPAPSREEPEYPWSQNPQKIGWMRDGRDLDFLTVEPLSFHLQPSSFRNKWDTRFVIRFDPYWYVLDDRSIAAKSYIEGFYHYMRYKIDELAPYESSGDQPVMPGWTVLHFRYKMGADAIWAAIPEELMLWKLIHGE